MSRGGKGGNGCRLIRDDPQIVAVEAGEEPQALWIRAGPVYHGDTQAPGPGIWIEYQEYHGRSPLSGPVLLTPEVWEELAAEMRKRLRRRRFRRQ